MAQTLLVLENLLRSIPDGCCKIVDKSINLESLGVEVAINPKLKIIKIVDNKSVYYLIERKRDYILVHDDKQVVEKLEDSILNAIVMRLKFKDKIERVRIIKERRHYIIKFNAEKPLKDIEVHPIIIGGKRYYFKIYLVNEKSVKIDYADFKKLFILKVLSKFKCKTD